MAFGAPAAHYSRPGAWSRSMLRRVTADHVRRPDASAKLDGDRAANDAEDRALVTRAQQGDRQALGALLQKYGPALYRSVLYPRLGSEAAAKDALAETYAKVVQNLAKFTWQDVGFYPWLRTVALRIAIDHLRARKRVVLFEAEDLEREIERDADDDQARADVALSEQRDREAARRKVDAALARINPRYASAIRMRVVEERPREDVARELGVTPATFDVLLHRAIAALKKALEMDGAGHGT